MEFPDGIFIQMDLISKQGKCSMMDRKSVRAQANEFEEPILTDWLDQATPMQYPRLLVAFADWRRSNMKEMASGASQF